MFGFSPFSRVAFVTVTNLIQKGNFPDDTGWAETNVGKSVANNVLTMLATATSGYIANDVALNRVAGHKYYIAAIVKSSSNIVGLHSMGSIIADAKHSGGNTFEKLSTVFTAASTIANWIVGVIDTRGVGWNNIDVKNVILIDLTNDFGAGNEPTKEEMNKLLLSFSESWFDGVGKMELPHQIEVVRNDPVVVDINGNGKYTDIKTAVETEPEGTVIYVMPGVYIVANGTYINAKTKRIILIGTDVNQCIIRSFDGRYNYPPIWGSCGYIEKVTIHAAYSAGTSNEVNTSTVGAYAFHCEDEYGVGKVLEFHHCTLISDFSSPIGAGLRKDFTLSFDDCEINHNQPITRGLQTLGGLYFHDSVGETGTQYLKVKDSILKSINNYAMRIEGVSSDDPANTVICEFINNTVYSEINGFTNNIVTNLDPLFSAGFQLSAMSHGNTNPILNAV